MYSNFYLFLSNLYFYIPLFFSILLENILKKTLYNIIRSIFNRFIFNTISPLNDLHRYIKY